MNKIVRLFKTYALHLLLIPGIAFSYSSCSKSGGVNIFSLDDDKKLGDQTSAAIEANPSQYPLLSPSQYPKAYEHINGIVNTILNSGKVVHKDDFVWTVKIIHDDSTLNAFCAPGGKVYVYTALIKYLDNEDQLAGVLAHEIAHADRRHITNQMTTDYGLSTLESIVLGNNPNALTQVANQLASLKFSRGHEAEADEYSSIYLCPTIYQADGAAGFFTKLAATGQGSKTPAFLSDHPSDASRITNIQNNAKSLNCGEKSAHTASYQDFKNSLP